MTINGRIIKLELLSSGHMAIDWTIDTHGTPTQSVLLATKVPRKDWTMPEVQAAMVKEIKNLQDNRTYQEVPNKPWMVVLNNFTRAEIIIIVESSNFGPLIGS